MRFNIIFQFELEEDLTLEEIENRLSLIEDWSEAEKECFLEIPAGFKSILVKRKLIED
jgi:hypothetical protein